MRNNLGNISQYSTCTRYEVLLLRVFYKYFGLLFSPGTTVVIHPTRTKYEVQTPVLHVKDGHFAGSIYEYEPSLPLFVGPCVYSVLLV